MKNPTICGNPSKKGSTGPLLGQMDGWLGVCNTDSVTLMETNWILKMIVFGLSLFTNDFANLKHQGSCQNLMIGWHKHQGVSETPKNADVICEQPLIDPHDNYLFQLMVSALRILRMVPGFFPTRHTPQTRTPFHSVRRLVWYKATSMPVLSSQKNASVETKFLQQLRPSNLTVTWTAQGTSLRSVAVVTEWMSTKLHLHLHLQLHLHLHLPLHLPLHLHLHLQVKKKSQQFEVEGWDKQTNKQRTNSQTGRNYVCSFYCIR